MTQKRSSKAIPKKMPKSVFTVRISGWPPEKGTESDIDSDVLAKEK